MNLLIEFLVEILVQIIGQIFFEATWQFLLKPALKGIGLKPGRIVSFIACSMLAIFLGSLSIVLAPRHFISFEEGRVLNLIATPVMLAFAMSWIGPFRKYEVTRRDSFVFAWWFSFVFLGIRLLAAKNV